MVRWRLSLAPVQVPNTVLVGYPRTDSGGAEFSEVVSQVTSMGNSLCVVKTAEDSPVP